MKKLFRKIHLWLSVPLGIFITLICFSGATLVYEQEITQCLRHSLYYVDEVKPATLPVDTLMARVQATLPDTVQATGITILPDPERTWQVNLSAPRRASVFVDPYTAEVKGRNERLAFFDTMFRLHRWLLGPSQGEDGAMPVGKAIVGIATLGLVIILLTGILMWLTNRRKPLRKSLTISFTKGWPRFWHDLHVAGGIYATVFLLAIALTGLTWSFGWYRTGFYALFGAEASEGGHGRHSGREAQFSQHHGKRGHGQHPHTAQASGDSARHEHRDGRRGHREAAEVAGKTRTDAVKSTARHSRPEAAAAPADSSTAQGGTEHRRHRGYHAEGSAHPYHGGHHRHRPSADSLGTDVAGHFTDSAAEGRHAADDLHEATTRPHRYDAAEAGGTSDNKGQLRRSTPSGVPEYSAGSTAVPHREYSGKSGGRGRKGRPATADTLSVALADTLADSRKDSLALGGGQAGEFPFAHWQTVYRQLAQANPGYRQITLKAGSAGVIPAGRRSLRAADTYEFAPQDGTITAVRLYADSDKGTRVRSAVYMVHVGSWLGGLTRLLNFLAALLGATLPLTGYFLWLRRLRNRRTRQTRE